jgi:hypothetical protein
VIWLLKVEPGDYGRWSEGASMSARDAGSAVTLFIPSKGSDSVLSRAWTSRCETRIWSISSLTPLLIRDQFAALQGAAENYPR